MCVALPGVLQLYEAQWSFNAGFYWTKLTSPREQSGIPEPGTLQTWLCLCVCVGGGGGGNCVCCRNTVIFHFKATCLDSSLNAKQHPVLCMILHDFYKLPLFAEYFWLE